MKRPLWPTVKFRSQAYSKFLNPASLLLTNLNFPRFWDDYVDIYYWKHGSGECAIYKYLQVYMFCIHRAHISMTDNCKQQVLLWNVTLNLSFFRQSTEETKTVFKYATRLHMKISHLTFNNHNRWKRTYSTWQRSSWEANSHWASQEIRFLLCIDENVSSEIL
jgi:hypothetical protein